MEVKEHRALVISKYALDGAAYSKEDCDCTWESCSLRKWLNEDFLNCAFDSEEKAKILEMEVSADRNPMYSTDPGNPTLDRIFLLSIPEVEKYFLTNDDRKCTLTAYAEEKALDPFGLFVWWLRTPGDNQNYAAYIGEDSSIEYGGELISEDLSAVRPAMWINLD